MTLHIHRTPMREVSRRSLGERWCFRHRDRADFVQVVSETIEPGYYDPTVTIECSQCGAADGDCGFGTCREWS